MLSDSCKHLQDSCKCQGQFALALNVLGSTVAVCIYWIKFLR
jgi:hypothetical protein